MWASRLSVVPLDRRRSHEGGPPGGRVPSESTGENGVIRYGNCLLGALALAWRHRTCRIGAFTGWRVPHLYVVAPDGRAWHFRVVEDVFPAPWCYLCFRGRFEELKRRPRGLTQTDVGW